MTPITASGPTFPATRAVTWTSCGTCWGQRRLWEDRNGEGLVPVRCPGCLGVGEQLRET
jgi:hypothetical protein